MTRTGPLGEHDLVTASSPAPEAALARLLAAADRVEGTGREACAAVLQATLAAAETDAEAVARLVTRLWFTPWRADAGERVEQRETAWLRPTKPVTVDAGGCRLAGFTAGSGPTVLLVHGWADHAARLGAFIEPLLASGLRVLGVDLPGHGRSGDGPADLPQWTQALSGVLAAEDVRAVVAHSLGGHAVVHALRSAPGVAAAVLVAPGVSLERSVAGFAALFGLPPLAVAVLRRELERLFGAAVWEDTDAARAARQLRLPALIVHSADDDRVDAADAQRLAAAWPKARLMLLDGLGHTRLLHAPEAVRPAAAFVAHVLLEAP